MAELRRTLRTEKVQRTNPFGPAVTTIEEDDYTIEAETTGELIVLLRAIAEEKSEEVLDDRDLPISASVNATVKNLDTGETENIVQQIIRTDDGDLVYTVEGKPHTVTVCADAYVPILRRLTGL